ncbi:hypothetical protein POUND7_004434 [Theobroma cacao]
MGELPFDLDEMSLRIPVVKLLMKKKMMMMMMMLQSCNLEKKILATGIWISKRFNDKKRRRLCLFSRFEFTGTRDNSDDNSVEDSNSTLDNDIDELLVDVDSRIRPASKTAIEGLEKVKIREGLGDERFCSVCLEEMSTEMEARRLPCSHIYHAACIIEWLKNNNKCPLCRYNMPVVDFDLNM